MGYEVMDAHGARQLSSGAIAPAPVDVVDLMADVGPAPPQPPAAPRWRTALAPGAAGGRGGLLPVAAALVLGALLGGFVSGQRTSADLRAAARSQLAVVAQVESRSLSREAGGVQADLTVRITNSGPDEVDLDTQAGASPNRLTPVVISGERQVGAGQSSTVRVQTLFACRGTPAVVVTVRTADGRGHEVPLQPPSPDGSLVALCSGAANAGSVSAGLAGTTTRPVVVVRNDGPAPAGVSFASVVSRGTPEVEGLVTILTTPAMPVVVQARGRRAVAVSVRATRCVRDLGVLARLGEISSPTLVVTDANGAVLPGGGSVDLGLLVSQALARACAERRP